MEPLSRRTFLKSLAATLVVVGFDPAQRSWVTSASAAGTFDRLPPLSGTLLTDEATLAAAATDFGGIIAKRPVAVLRPGSVDDVVAMVRYARRHNLKLAARGQGHSTYGQPQVDAGVVIDMSSLGAIHRLDADRIEVGAGLRWSDLLQATLARGLTPPVMTDYIDLSVGGTLTVGGIGGASHRYGVQADNVLELDVVTGEGHLEHCSPRRQPELFRAVLAGLGQFGIIVRATLRLVPAQTSARVFQLYYDELTTFTDDQKRLIGDERFNYVEGQVLPNGEGGWYYMLEAASFFTAPTLPDNARLLAGLRHDPVTALIEDKPYIDFINRLAPTVAFLKAIGVWGFPHPWYDVFVPASKVVGYVGGIVATLTLADTGQGPVLLYPVKTSRFTNPFFRVPNEPVVFLFDILRTGSPDPAVVASMLASNRQLFEQARDLGGNRYAIGAIPFERSDWRQHFGKAWPLLRAMKARYDPQNLLAPGQGIFGRS